MNSKFVCLLASLLLAMDIFLGVVGFGDHFVRGCVVVSFAFACAIAWPLAFAFERSVRRRKSELFRELMEQDRWSQDVVLTALDDNTRAEFLSKTRQVSA